MDKIFLSVLNMSLTASFVIAAIMLARLLLKKAPKIISYALWAVAGFRLVFPFTLESVFSLMPIKAAPIPQDIAMQTVPRIDSGIRVIDNSVSAALPAATPIASANPLQTWIFIGSCVWLLGVSTMLIHSIVSIVLLKRGLRGSEHIEGNLYQAGNLRTPFVIGLFRPRIYVPSGLTDKERDYVILHEQTHIRRRDHAVKMLAHLALCLHWFNPLAWAAFILMGADMEMSCDERVMRQLGGDIKKAYSLTLVRVAARRKILNGSPLAFGEGGMKERVKNVLNFKKRSRVIIIAAIILATALTMGFAVSRARSDEGISAETAVEQLANSIEYVDEAIRFQIPADYPNAKDWNIHISGRAEFEDGFSMSFHELEDVNDSHAWESGKWYTIPLEGRYLMEFAMDIYLPDENEYILEKSVDLLTIIPTVPNTETDAPTVALYRNADNVESQTRMYSEADTGWTIIPDTISVCVFVSDGTVALRTYYAEAGADATAHIMLDTKYSVPFINARDASSLVSERYTSRKPTGNTWRVADDYPDGFLGHIWAVTTDADGVEHMSDIIKVIYETDAESIPDTAEDAQATGVFIWPLQDHSHVARRFGVRVHPIYKITVSHDGIDIVAPDGTPILAADTGTVAEMGENETDGYYIRLDHGNGFQTFYAQMQGFTEGLANGDTVKKGDIIGFVGSTGDATGAHLHFGVSLDGNFANPLVYFNNYQLSPAEE